MSKTVDEQFKRCKEIFVQYKIIVPALVGILIGLTLGGYTVGAQISNIKNEITTLKKTPLRLIKIERSLDTLIFLQRSK